MRILLFGDFSGYHKNLKVGLESLGHNVNIASDGNKWKKIEGADINLDFSKRKFPKIYLRLYLLFKIYLFIGYDVIQIMSPDYLYLRSFPRKIFFKLLKFFNKKIFLLAAGSDGYYWKYGRKNLRYSIHNDHLKIDLKLDKHPKESKRYFQFNKYIADNCDGIIPIVYDYSICYEGHKNLLKIIPIPLDFKSVDYKKNIVKKKLIVFHGLSLSRNGFKGTHYIKEAFDYLRKKYDNDLELIIKGEMALKDYLLLMKKANVVIDQVNSYSVGLNGLYAMAMGKVLLGGAEPESLTSLGVNSTPVINIKPHVKNIITNIEKLVNEKEKISEIGFKSRKFVEKHHDPKKIASQFIKAWES